MEHTVILLVLTLMVISATACVAPWLGVPAQRVLVLAGIGISLIPSSPDVTVDPQLILLGLLPPMLYASATTISATNFRRDFRAINGLSIVLVVLSSLALGALFKHLIPGLGFGCGAALGAILSPTDAVAVGGVAALLNLAIRRQVHEEAVGFSPSGIHDSPRWPGPRRHW